MAEIQTLVDFLTKLGPYGLTLVVGYLLYLGKLRLEREVIATQENAKLRIEVAEAAETRARKERDDALNTLAETTEAQAQLVAGFRELRNTIEAVLQMVVRK